MAGKTNRGDGIAVCGKDIANHELVKHPDYLVRGTMEIMALDDMLQVSGGGHAAGWWGKDKSHVAGRWGIGGGVLLCVMRAHESGAWLRGCLV